MGVVGEGEEEGVVVRGGGEAGPSNHNKTSTARIVEWQADSPPPPVPDVNFAEYILQSFQSHSHDVAMVNVQEGTIEGETHTYTQLQREVSWVAGGLVASGVRPGDVVLLLTHTHFDYATVLLAVVYMGGVCVPISAGLKSEELAHVIKVSSAKYAIIQHKSAARENLRGALSLLPRGVLRQVWKLEREEEEEEEEDTTPSLSHLLRGPPVPPHNMAHTASTTPAVMFFSSGTTGLPKGVLLSHTNLLAPHLCNRYMLDLTTKTLGNDAALLLSAAYARMLLLLPLHHIYGFHMLMIAFCFGFTSYLLPHFSPVKFFSAIEKYKITACPMVPHLASFLADSPLTSKYDLSSLRSVSSSTAPLSSATIHSLLHKRGLEIGNGYGMTEAVCIATNGGLFGFNPESVGKIMPYTQVKVTDINTGQPLGEGEEGEVCVKSATVMMGYVNNSTATAETIDPQGWLHTGDLGYYDKDNFIFLTDRMKDLIKVKGFQVSPKEVEEVILKVEGVLEVAVVGVPHHRTGEAARAWVVLKEGTHTTPQHIQRAVRG
ncbi:hypothetical protein Pmani_014957, partial [Petrolisthes manimaculis]